jgi:cellulose synthase/poly-beta-1,6-N-acetylglucosamine synthase-like glycosyltransferase
MTLVGLVLVLTPIVIGVYAYVVYPVALYLAGRYRPTPRQQQDPAEWPSISIVIVAHNAEATIRATLEQLLTADYPAERRQIIVASDASTDGTERIAEELAPHGVELHRVLRRGGKTAAENDVAARVRGDIVVSTDASVLLAPSAIKTLVRHFSDPCVGVVSGRAVSAPVAATAAVGSGGDRVYYGYEMWVRALETRFGAVIGATGAFYASRRSIFAVALAPQATRDFASPLIAHDRGYRSVLEVDAVCLVRPTPSLLREYQRKVRTMVGGLDTLNEFRHLMDPMRYGAFAFMLVSHKLCRWLVYLLAPLAVIGVLLLATESWSARAAVVLGLALIAAGLIAVRWPAHRRLPAPVALCGYAVVGGAAGAAAWSRFLRGAHAVVWEPTSRAS